MSIRESDAIRHYVNPKRGFWGKTKQLKKYREMLNKVYALQRHKEVTSKGLKKLYKREGAIRPFFSVQVDLADFPKLQNPLNKNIRYLMVCIDVFSRYMWVYPLRTKKGLHVALGQIFLQMKREFGKTPENMTGDNEFDTRELKKLADKFKFRWWFGDPNEKYRTGIVERSIRTIRNLLKRYLTQNDTTKYIDVLDDLVENYNDTEHSHTRSKPKVAIKTGQSFPKPMKKDIPILRVGDKVRILQKRQRAFDKGDKPYYSKQLYEIVRKDGNKYVVRNIDTGEVYDKKYYIHQLLHVKGVIKDKSKENNDNVGYDKGIEHKTIQKKNKRSLKGIDIENIISDDEREQAKKDLHYNDDDFFHDKPLPKNISNKQLQKKQKQLEEKVDKQIDKNDKGNELDDEIKKLEDQLGDLWKSKNRNRRAHIKRLRYKIRALKEKQKKLKSVKKKHQQQKSLVPLRRGKRNRKKVKRYGYDKRKK